VAEAVSCARRAAARGPGVVRINIGCGTAPTNGWANFDNSPVVRVARWPVLVRALAAARLLGRESREFAGVASRTGIRFADAARRIPCGDGAVDVLYSSHMIEHLDRPGAKAFLMEARRVLRPGGIVRVCAPDLALLVRAYTATGDADTLVARSHMCQRAPGGVRARMKMALIGPRHHLWMYDGTSLARLLTDAGFTNVAIMPAGTTNIPEPGDLNLAERVDESIYVEGFQP
jgi:predicted SAM-dependent methyltransferase